MIGAIIGDIAGSRFEWVNYRAKDFAVFADTCMYTDDSVMTLAIAQAVTTPYNNMEELSKNAQECMHKLGRKYLCCGFGGRFFNWLLSDNPEPYQSFGNGSAMRISPVGFAARDIAEAKAMSEAVTKVTHNHPEGLKGAEAVAVAMVLARQGKSKEEIAEYVKDNYYKIDFTLNDIRDKYVFNETCQGSVPQAFQAFFESCDFEDAIKNAVSIGGDSDTIAAIAGALAEAYYGVPKAFERVALKYLDETLARIYLSAIKLNKIVE